MAELIDVKMMPKRCDLLENYYLCAIRNNPKPITYSSPAVVICLKIIIFAL